MVDPEPSLATMTSTERRALVAFWVGICVLRLVTASQLGLAADEAYYWTWSQDLAWGYFDHPPAIALLIRTSVELFGQSEVGVRALGLLLQSGILLAFVLQFERDTEGDPWLLTGLLVMPLFFLGGILATPDVPLLLAWLVGLMALQRERWLLFGLACGLAILSKLTGVLLWPVAFLAFPQHRLAILKAGGVAALVLIPFIAWQAQNEWISIVFQLDHGFGSRTYGFAGLLEGLAGQAAVVGPFLFVAGCIWAFRERKSRGVMWWSFIVPLGAFVASGIGARPEANWMAPAWLGASWGLAESVGRLRRLSWVGALSGGVISLLVLGHALFSFWSLPKDPVDRLRMGPLLAEKIADWGEESVVCERYQEASWLAFYANLETTTLPNFSRDDQFDLWERPPLGEGLYLRPAARRPLEAEVHWSKIWDDTRFHLSHNGRKIGAWQVYRTSEAR